MRSRLFHAAKVLCLLVPALSAQAESAAIAGLFERAGAEGTLLIESLRSGRRLVHDEARAAQPFTAASTFKVLNTLIALEEGVIEGAESTLRWDGRRHDYQPWNRDQTLESAFKVSCVWCYQALARRIGGEKYAEYLRKVGYGELREPFELTEFWLDGSLRVSARGQVDFLREVVQRRLPFRGSSYDTLARVMDLGDQVAGLHAKSGWAARGTPQIGWYVGYLETADDVWLFALNMNIRSRNDLPLRRKLVLDALALEGILVNPDQEPT